MKILREYKVLDRTFNCSHEHSMAIWQFIAENDNGITRFHIELSADLLTEEEIAYVGTFRKGLVQFEIGVQSFNPKTLDSINRHSDMDKLVHNIRSLYEPRNMHIHLDLIAGLPYEDITSFASSFNSVYSLRPDELQLGFLKVLNGSEMSASEEQYGITRNTYAPYEVLKTRWLSFDDILELKQVETVVGIFYNSKQFENSLRYLLGLSGSAYELYRSLGKYYSESFDIGVSHSRQKRYEFILEYAEAGLVNHNAGSEASDASAKACDTALLKELLTYDIYLRENCNTRPSFAPVDCDRTREVKRHLSSRNTNSNNNTNSSNFSRQFHVEQFEYDIKHFMDTGNVSKKKSVYLFDYEQRDIITNNVKITEITITT